MSAATDGFSAMIRVLANGNGWPGEASGDGTGAVDAGKKRTADTTPTLAQRGRDLVRQLTPAFRPAGVHGRLGLARSLPSTAGQRRDDCPRARVRSTPPSTASAGRPVRATSASMSAGSSAQRREQSRAPRWARRAADCTAAAGGRESQAPRECPARSRPASRLRGSACDSLSPAASGSSRESRTLRVPARPRSAR